MKKIFIALFTVVTFVSMAQNNSKWHMGIHTGLDIGAAVPWPLNKAVGGGDKMSATPRLTPAIGLSGTYEYNDRWSLNVEATYKTVALNASIITLNGGQKFKDGDLDVLFYGQAKTSMSFSMLEVPLYVKFKLCDKHRVTLGGYYAFILNGDFKASAMKGRIEDDQGGITVVNPSDPLNQDFSMNLDSWDAGWQVGYEYMLLKNLSLSGRFSMGFKDIFKKNENYLDYSMWHMRGIITISYRLF